MYRASLAQARGDVAGTAEHARRALALAGSERPLPRGGAAGFLGLAAWAAGDLGTAVDTFSDAVAQPACGRQRGRRARHDRGLGHDVAGARPTRQARRLYELGADVAERQRGAAGRPPGTCTSGWPTCSGSGGPGRGRGAPRASAGRSATGRRPGEPAPLVRGDGRTAAGAWRPGRRGRHARRGGTAVPPGLLPRRAPHPGRLARVRIAQGRLADAWEWAREHGRRPRRTTWRTSPSTTTSPSLGCWWPSTRR